MRISDWSSDVCSSDLRERAFFQCSRPETERSCPSGAAEGGDPRPGRGETRKSPCDARVRASRLSKVQATPAQPARSVRRVPLDQRASASCAARGPPFSVGALLWQRKRSEEHTSELQSLMRTSYAVFCLKKKIQITNTIY